MISPKDKGEDGMNAVSSWVSYGTGGAVYENVEGGCIFAVVAEEGAAEAGGVATKLEEAEETELTRIGIRVVKPTMTESAVTTRRWPGQADLRNLCQRLCIIVAISKMQRCLIA